MNKHVFFLLSAFIATIHGTALAKDKVSVSVKTVESLRFYHVQSAPAIVKPLNHAKVPARTSGIVETLYFRVGDTVKKGQVIVSLDCRDTQLTFAQLKAQTQQLQQELSFARRDLKRATKLEDSNALTKAELDRKKTNVATTKAQTAALKAQLEQQNLNVERCQVKAPFSGTLTDRLVNLGEQVNVGQTMVELLQNQRLEVSAKIALSDRTAFDNAADYWFEVNQEKYPLALRTVVPMVSNNSRSIESRFEFKQQVAYSGVTGRVKWRTREAYLPGYLLQKRNGHYGFFVVEQNRAKFIKVDNAREGSPMKLPDDNNYQVIIDGRYGLTDNKPLELKQPSTAPLLSGK